MNNVLDLGQLVLEQASEKSMEEYMVSSSLILLRFKVENGSLAVIICELVQQLDFVRHGCQSLFLPGSVFLLIRVLVGCRR